MRRRLLLLLLVLLTALIPASVAAQDTRNDDEVLVRVNGSDQVAENERIDVVVVVDGNVEVAGTVEDVLVVVDGDTVVTGQVNGNIWQISGMLTLEDESRVDGDIILGQDATLSQDQGAVVTGEVREDSWNFDPGSDFAWTMGILYLVFWLGTSVILLVGALIFAGIGGRQLWSSAGRLTGSPGRTILATVVFWVVVTAITVILFATVFGIPLALLIMAIAWAIWVLGYIVVGTRIGALVTGRSTGDQNVDHPYLSAFVGTLILQIVALVATVGGFFASFSNVLFSDGGLIGALIGVPTALIGFLLWLLGILGVGALTYRAWLAWTSPGRQPAPVGEQKP